MFCTFVFLIIIAIIPFPLFCVEFYVFTEVESFNNIVGNVNILEVLNKSSPATCWRSCHRNKQCSAYFENDSENECRLVSANLTEHQVKVEAGWKYVVKSLIQRSCPTYLGFIFDQVSNLCFKLLSKTKLPRTDATALCATIGGRLLRIKNDKHQAAVVAYIEKTIPGENVMIDGSRSDSNSSNWTFSDWEPMTYFHWADGNQDNTKTFIKLDKNRNLYWTTASNQPKLFLCEVSLDEM